jgi:hypothetical protein
MPKEEKFANNTNEGFSQNSDRIPKQDPYLRDCYSNVGSQEDIVIPLCSSNMSETVRIPTPLVSKQIGLETSVSSVRDVKSTKAKIKLEQKVDNKFKKNDMFWFYWFCYI